MKFKKGDIITSQSNVDRVIVKVLRNSYLWRYSELAYGVYDSIDSNDPLLEWWELKPTLDSL